MLKMIKQSPLSPAFLFCVPFVCLGAIFYVVGVLVRTKVSFARFTVLTIEEPLISD